MKIFMKNRRNEEINNITKEIIALVYYKLSMQKSKISIKKICDTAGVSRNAYYRNFESIDEIDIYYFILKWKEYCEINSGDKEVSKNVDEHLIKVFYSEKDFISAIKEQGEIIFNGGII